MNKIKHKAPLLFATLWIVLSIGFSITWLPLFAWVLLTILLIAGLLFYKLGTPLLWFATFLFAFIVTYSTINERVTWTTCGKLVNTYGTILDQNGNGWSKEFNTCAQNINLESFLETLTAGK